MNMFTLSPEMVEGILRRLDFLRVEAGDIAAFQEMTQSEYAENRDRRRSLERLAENVANAVADIAKILLTGSELPAPNTYRDIVLALATIGILDEPLAQKLGDMVRLRNIVAHDYLDIRWSSLRRFLDQAPAAIREFLACIDRLPGLA